jgi:hypothetical protein
MSNLLRSPDKKAAWGDMGFLSTAKTYKLKRIFGKFLFLRSYFTKLLEGIFFLFLQQRQNRELFYKTPADALSVFACCFTELAWQAGVSRHLILSV